jgi:hypothetical protein
MRAAEEPLKSDLDVAGLKARVLGRIEEPESRERKRKELLAERDQCRMLVMDF